MTTISTDQTDKRPAATSLRLCERTAQPPNALEAASLHHAELRAINQALGYLGLSESGRLTHDESAVRPRTTADYERDDPYAPTPRPVRRAAASPATTTWPRGALQEQLADLDALIVAALGAGLRLARARAWRARLHALGAAAAHDDAEGTTMRATLTHLERLERRLRCWIAQFDSA